jgi:hypothetical protein
VLVAALVGLLAPLGLGAATPAAASGLRHQVLFSFADHRIPESSGLVDAGRLVYTINDSGDGPYVYVVDAGSGRTAGVTTYSQGEVTDVEAIAPGRSGSVWVGDIGDNSADRSSVAVYHLPHPAAGDRTVSGRRYDLTYPDGSHNAEALLVQPRTQRLFVVSKSVFGGTVYAAPRTLHATGDTRLHAFARVSGLVTDGTFFPDGKHVLLRTYGTASVYTFPDFRLLGTVTLPPQRQGEGISVGHGGRVLISSEGVHSEVQEVRLPTALDRLIAGRALHTPRPSNASTTGPRPRADPAANPPEPGISLGVVLVAVVLAGAGYLAVRGSRPRSPRKR